MKVVIEAGNLAEAAKLALQYDLGRYAEVLEKAQPSADDVSEFLVQRLQRMDIAARFAKDPDDVPCVYGIVFAMPVEVTHQGEQVITLNLAVRPKTDDRLTRVVISA